MMCAHCRYLDYRNPSKYITRNCGGLIKARVNKFTGEEVPVELWVNEIHPEDWEWFEQLWDESDRLDFEIRMAGAP